MELTTVDEDEREEAAGWREHEKEVGESWNEQLAVVGLAAFVPSLVQGHAAHGSLPLGNSKDRK